MLQVVCKYCVKSTANKPWHPECRAVFLEDLLAKLQTALQTIMFQGVPSELAKILSADTFQTKEEYLANKENHDSLESRQKRWMISRQQATQGFLSDWEKDHPEPDQKPFTAA